MRTSTCFNKLHADCAGNSSSTPNTNGSTVLLNGNASFRERDYDQLKVLFGGGFCKANREHRCPSSTKSAARKQPIAIRHSGFLHSRVEIRTHTSLFFLFPLETIQRNNCSDAALLGWQKIHRYPIRNLETDPLQIHPLSTHGETAVASILRGESYYFWTSFTLDPLWRPTLIWWH